MNSAEECVLAVRQSVSTLDDQERIEELHAVLSALERDAVETYDELRLDYAEAWLSEREIFRHDEGGLGGDAQRPYVLSFFAGLDLLDRITAIQIVIYSIERDLGYDDYETPEHVDADGNYSEKPPRYRGWDTSEIDKCLAEAKLLDDTEIP